jgi:hypothetical protein
VTRNLKRCYAHGSIISHVAEQHGFKVNDPTYWRRASASAQQGDLSHIGAHDWLEFAEVRAAPRVLSRVSVTEKSHLAHALSEFHH